MRLGNFLHDIRKLLRKRLPGKGAEHKKATTTTARKGRTSALRGSGLDFISGPIPDLKQEGWYVFSTVRNEVLRLPYLLRFYREMGATLFIIADNQSQDGTTEYLREQPDVVLFRAGSRYSESRFGVDWLNTLLHRFGQNRWCLTVDADELLVFPHCEQVGLAELTRYLEARGANALPTFLLDMYSMEPIREAHYQAGTPFLSVCPFFDATGYWKQAGAGPTRDLPTRGGPRYRLFWEGRVRERASPFLPKIPLVKWSKDLCYEASTHKISGARISVSDITGALLHFKFFADFPSRVEEEVKRQEQFDGASQCSAYWEVVSQQPDVGAFYEGSVRYRGSLQLMEMGLMRSSHTFDLVASPVRELATENDN